LGADVKVEVLAEFLKDKQCCPHGEHEHETLLGESSLPSHVPSACWDLALEHQGRRVNVKTWCAACHGERAVRETIRVEFPGISAA
jgi:hypothetical protein